MITSFKLFERVFICDTPDREINVGDYAKIYSREDGYYGEDFNEFIKDHIGIVTKVNNALEYDIKFLPNNDDDVSYKTYDKIEFEKHEISVSAPSKDELESILLSIKFNL